MGPKVSMGGTSKAKSESELDIVTLGKAGNIYSES
jgi:hypothetical protein